MTTITINRAVMQQAQEIDVYSYAALLATAIHAKHYKDTAPQWTPLPDLLGVLTQIDNMTAGLIRQPEPAQKRAEPVAQQTEPLTVERLRDALVASRIIQPAAVEDPDEYDDGVTLYRIEALHRRIT